MRRGRTSILATAVCPRAPHLRRGGFREYDAKKRTDEGEGPAVRNTPRPTEGPQTQLEWKDVLFLLSGLPEAVRTGSARRRGLLGEFRVRRNRGGRKCRRKSAPALTRTFRSSIAISAIATCVPTNQCFAPPSAPVLPRALGALLDERDREGSGAPPTLSAAVRVILAPCVHTQGAATGVPLHQLQGHLQCKHVKTTLRNDRQRDVRNSPRMEAMPSIPSE